MTFHALKTRNTRRCLPDLAVGFARHALGGDNFHKFMNRQPAGVVRRPFSWQDMVGAGTFIAIGHGGFLTDK